MNPRRRRIASWAVLVLAGVAAARAGISAAQVIHNGRVVVAQALHAGEAGSDLAPNVFLPPDRKVLQQLAKARRLLEDGRYGDAVRCLGAILDGPEDYFFQPDKKVPIHRSLKAEARRLIGQMPPEGRELYELDCGSRARQRLAEAVAAGDAAGIAEVARRFFHTQAGYEATLLLGMDHLDRGRPLAGALTLERVRGAGPTADRFEPALSLALATCWLRAATPEKARDVVSALKERQGGEGIEIGGEAISWFADDADAVDWLAAIVGPQHQAGPKGADRWLMFRGSPSRNAVTAASAPLLNMRWRIPTTDDPWLEAKLRRDYQAYLDRGIPVLPRFHPLAVGNVVLMRTLRTLLAVDFVTGKRLWEVPVEDPFERLLGSDRARSARSAAAQLTAGLGYRLWDDATYGTISSDGRCVFTIEDLPVAVTTRSRSRTVIINGRRVTQPAPRPYNRLAAHDLRTGKLKWHLGGPSDQFALPQAESFFLGPPLPLMGKLYVLAEIKGEIRLLALEAKSGDRLWSQQLAIVEREVVEDPFRRLAGVSPSYADGILVCPTAAGAVVGVDLATRSLLWGYCYGRHRNTSRSAQLIALRMGRYRGSDPQSRWCDATALVEDGRVLVTPVESDSLHCLNLIDGQLQWKCKRADDLFVACVHGDKVVLVGRRQVRAVSLSETVETTETTTTMERTAGGYKQVQETATVVRPKPAWDGRTVALPEGTMPSGRGFSSDNRYFLPLTSAEVLAIDLVKGKAEGVSKSRKRNVPGNLVCYKGRVISQGVDALEVFYQLDAARQEVDRRLAAHPEDPVALSLRGEILLNEGKRAEAIACFRRAYDRDPDARTRSLLREALLEGLRSQFAAYRRRAEEIRELLDEPAHRATYLRAMATGLQGAGEWQAALDHYLKLVELDHDHHLIEPITQAYSVRLSRWIRAQVGALRDEAKDALTAIDRRIEARAQSAVELGTLDSLRRFLDYFGDHPSAGKVRRELSRRLKDSGRYLEAELVLWREQGSADPSVAAGALAELAGLLREAGRPEDAAVCYRRLGRQFADVVCLEGKTGKQLFEGLPKGGPVEEALHGSPRWPVGRVDAKRASTSSRRAHSGRLAVPYRGTRGPFLSETAIRFDQSPPLILGRDPLGQQRWQLSLAQPGAPQRFPFNYSLTHARVCGHLLVVSLGYKIIAVDTLGASGDHQPALAWSHDLTSDPTFVRTDFHQMAALQIAAAGGPWIVPPFGFGGLGFTGYSDTRLNGLGPVTSHYVCFQRNRDLLAVDPLTGKILWTRHGTAPGSKVFGGDQFVFVLPRGRTEALVLRALDGKLSGKRELPPFIPTEIQPDGTRADVSIPSGKCFIAALGRQLLVWDRTGGHARLGLFDPWQKRQVWTPRQFAPGAKFDLVEQEAIGIWEPGGRFVLVGLPDGRTIADVQLKREKSLSAISVFRFGDQYLLLADTSQPQANPNRRIQPVPGTLSRPIGRGRVYLLDLEGNLVWPEPAEIRDQRLLIHQPARLPVLVFACHVYDRTRGARRHRVLVACLDKRSGRMIGPPWEFPYATGTFEISGDPKTHTVELRLPRDRVTMAFTDEPVKGPSGLSKIGSGLLKAVGKVIGQAAGGTPAPPRHLFPRPEPKPEPEPEPEPKPEPADDPFR